MGNPILRQIVDIQVQAERLFSRKSNLDEIEEFAKYNSEIKRFLLENVNDEFILNYVREIPDLNLEDLGGGVTGNVAAGIISIFTTGIASYFRNKQKNQEALNIIRDIRGKYASIEFMCKEYFSQ